MRFERILLIYPLALFAALLFSTALGARPTSSASPAPEPMPADRAAIAYHLYSGLIPLGEQGLPGWSNDLFLVKDATIKIIPDGESCSQFTGGMNPHTAVHPAPGGEEDYKEILEDFDLHCHRQFALAPGNLKLSAPVRLLTPREQEEFRSSQIKHLKDAAAAAKYKGASALYGFSELYFNSNHTVALLLATDWCGNLCGQQFWIAVGLENGHWHGLHWNVAMAIS